MANMTSWQTLGYLGLIPFVAVVMTTNSNTDIVGVSNYLIFSAYSACILSFLAGTLWLKHHNEQETAPTFLSNAFTLVAFAGLLLPPIFALPLLAIGYLTLLASEFKLGLFTNKPEGYLLLRTVLTAIVVVCHLLMIINLPEQT
ncbi:DUF3429 domain-containing protein [Thalassotalea euphylliae]|uniref:DUF3429 domain-containing protein n=1 Tax=Thalassotalea euphylliae TaxID=1655234 RepID=UPI00362586AB